MKRVVFGALVLGCLAFAPMLWFDLSRGDGACIGETHNGSLRGAKRLAWTGENFRPFCHLCVLALRTYGDARVIDAVEAGFEDVATQTDAEFAYGEIGFPWGGRFYPHKTHRNGLSVDFMVPLVDGVMPLNAWERFGYDLEFDHGTGAKGADRIDFDAITAHLLALDSAARVRGGQVARVFFAPDLQGNLSSEVRAKLRFNTRQSWVRHDDHYHVDFAFPCAG